MQNYLQNIQIAWTSCYETFRSPAYVALALVVAASVFVFSIWLPNLELIRAMVFASNLTLLKKVTFLWHSLGAITTNFDVLSATLTVCISVLFGLNMALTVSYFTQRLAFQKASGMHIAGMLAGLIGIGCASCGSIVLSVFLGVGATAAFTGLLPLGGQEFSILSIVILVGALYITAKKAVNPLVCKVELHK